MKSLIHDFRQALRGLARNPGFAVVAILTLAVGIGINAAVFTVISSTLTRPLPFADADRLVVIYSTLPEMGWFDASASILELQDLRDRGEHLEDVAVSAFHRSVNLEGRGPAQRLETDFVTAAYFSLLGAKPALGRTFLPEEDFPPGGHPVAVLSHHLWRNQFGGDPGVVGSSITLTGQSFTVIGIMSPEFQDLREGAAPDIWLPLSMGTSFFMQDMFENRQDRQYMGLARLASGRTLIEAQKEADSIAERLREEQTYTHQGRGLRLVPLYEYFYGRLEKPLQTLLAGAGFVLLICCVNIAMLLLARGQTRRQEVALRISLGASRSQVIQYALAESVLLALMGGALGALIACWTTEVWVASSGLRLPAFVQVRFNAEVFGLSVLAAVGTGLLVGLAPALQLARTDLRNSLQAAGRQVQVGRGTRHRNLLVTAEVALTMVLLVGAALTAKSLYRLINADLGFRAHGILTMNLELRGPKYQELEERNRFVERALDELRSLPGVEDASLWGPSMLGEAVWNWRVTPRGVGESDPRYQVMVQRIYLSPGSLRALGIPVLRGRDFTRSDHPDTVLMSRRLTQFLWPGEDPLGKQFTIGPDPNMPPITVIGVTGEALHRGRLRPQDEVAGDVYISSLKYAPRDLSILVWHRGDLSATLVAIRSLMRRIDPDLPLFNIATMDERLEREESGHRLTASLMSLYAGIAVFLAALGLYGVLAYTLRQRTPELAMRSALGARSRQLKWMVIRQGMLWVVLGIVFGLSIAFTLLKYAESLLFGVSRVDPLVYGSMVLLLLLVALAACYLPARLASSVDPIKVLRGE